MISPHYIYTISNCIYTIYLHNVSARSRLSRSPTRGGPELCGGGCALRTQPLCTSELSIITHQEVSSISTHIYEISKKYLQ